MCMHEALFGDYPIPEDTLRIAQRAFPKGNLYMQIRDQFGMLYQNHQFAHLQHVLTAAAINLKRVLAWWEEIPRAKTRNSAFAALAPL
jgi:transposase